MHWKLNVYLTLIVMVSGDWTHASYLEDAQMLLRRGISPYQTDKSPLASIYVENLEKELNRAWTNRRQPSIGPYACEVFIEYSENVPLGEHVWIKKFHETILKGYPHIMDCRLVDSEGMIRGYNFYLHIKNVYRGVFNANSSSVDRSEFSAIIKIWVCRKLDEKPN